MAEIVDLIEKELSEDFLSIIQAFRCTYKIDEHNISTDIEDFLKNDAYELQQSHMTVTKLFFNSDKQLVGYYTLFNDTVPKIGKDKLKKEHWDLPKSEKFYPAVRLHYIGVDDKYRDQDIGYTMLMSAIDTCYTISTISGCVFMSVQALKNSVGFYENYNFIRLSSGKYLQNMVLKLEDISDTE